MWSWGGMQIPMFRSGPDHAPIYFHVKDDLTIISGTTRKSVAQQLYGRL
jgi:hypothetical protein